MTQSRYREARTLVRRLCRLPGEDCEKFKQKIARLRWNDIDEWHAVKCVP